MLLYIIVGVDMRLGNRVVQYTVVGQLFGVKHQAHFPPLLRDGHLLHLYVVNNERGTNYNNQFNISIRLSYMTIRRQSLLNRSINHHMHHQCHIHTHIPTSPLSTFSARLTSPPVTSCTNSFGGSKSITWKCSTACTLFSAPQLRNQITFSSPQTLPNVRRTKPSSSALVSGSRSSVTASEGVANLVQTTRCTIRVSMPYGQSLSRIL
jgi:hypothetical protein